jgi:hypothetical protein
MSLPIPGTGKHKLPNVERILWRGLSHRKSSRWDPRYAKRVREIRYSMIME